MTTSKGLLSLDDLITSSGKYPDRAKSNELTEEVKQNLLLLLERVNAILSDLEIDKVEVSSGFRPSSVNASIAGAAKKSLHMRGLAVDLADQSGTLKGIIQCSPHLLKTYELWLESPDATPTWCHLDLGTRSERPIRIFKP